MARSRSRLLTHRRSRRQRSTFRLHKPRWVDPYPWIPGTVPEKMLFAALVQRRIYFIFQGDFPDRNDVGAVLMQKFNFKPDIILPEHRVVIDPFGEFHHVQPESVKRDVWKWVVYTHQFHYSFYHPWASEITQHGAHRFLDTIPELREGPKWPLTDPRDRAAKETDGYRVGRNVGAGASSVAASNRARARRKPRLGIVLRRR